MHVSEPHRLQGCVAERSILADLYKGYRLKPSIPCQVGSTSLSPAAGFEHPASTLSTRFPAALGIGHGLPAA